MTRRLGRHTICPPERETQPVWTQSWLGQPLSLIHISEGKKPLVISFDDVNYYDYMLAEGFTSKLV